MRQTLFAFASLSFVFETAYGPSASAQTQGRFAGAVDLSFDPGNGPDGVVELITLQPDDKILIAGQFTHIANVPRPAIARLNPDGSLDPTFNAGTQFTPGSINQLIVQPDQKVLVRIGEYTRYGIRIEYGGAVTNLRLN